MNHLFSNEQVIFCVFGPKNFTWTLHEKNISLYRDTKRAIFTAKYAKKTSIVVQKYSKNRVVSKLNAPIGLAGLLMENIKRGSSFYRCKNLLQNEDYCIDVFSTYVNFKEWHKYTRFSVNLLNPVLLFAIFDTIILRIYFL